MFTGIIEATGQIIKITSIGKNKRFWIKSAISGELKVDQSLSHNGVCLTVEEADHEVHVATAVAETLKKTSLSGWKEGNIINLERCLMLNSRIDGHLVQGHVDCEATCVSRVDADGSWEFVFEFPKKFYPLLVEKGSVCVDGISLTAFAVSKKHFSVAIIPYTFLHTNIQHLNKGDRVNIEFDLVGKYIMSAIKKSRKI